MASLGAVEQETQVQNDLNSSLYSPVVINAFARVLGQTAVLIKVTSLGEGEGGWFENSEVVK